jgi:hypothetical protein
MKSPLTRRTSACSVNPERLTSLAKENAKSLYWLAPVNGNPAKLTTPVPAVGTVVIVAL